MQTANVNLPITVTVRHEQVTDALREHAHRKIESLHLDYPRIIEAKAILDVQKNRHVAEIILFCANHITIEAHTEGKDMYAALDETIEKIARRMRKHKTRLMKKNRPHRNESIRHLEERYFNEEALDHPEESEPIPFPTSSIRITMRSARCIKKTPSCSSNSRTAPSCSTRVPAAGA
jgi:putative sigma-54 modulation protein